VVYVVEVLVIIQYSVPVVRSEYTLICRDCVIPVTSTGCISVDIGVNANRELVDKLCYLGDMLNVDGDADAAVENRIRIGWNKFRQLVPLLTNKNISLKVRGRLYSGCVRSTMLHGSETWPVTQVNHGSTGYPGKIGRLTRELTQEVNLSKVSWKNVLFRISKVNCKVNFNLHVEQPALRLSTHQ